MDNSARRGRRRQRLDLGQDNTTNKQENVAAMQAFMDEMDHIRTCPLLKYIEQPVDVVDIDDGGGVYPRGWKKVRVPPPAAAAAMGVSQPSSSGDNNATREKTKFCSVSESKSRSTSAPLEYYWHVETGKLQRHVPSLQASPIHAHAVDKQDDTLEGVVESLHQNAVLLASKAEDISNVSESSRMAIHAAVVSQMAQAFLNTMTSLRNNAHDTSATTENILLHVLKQEEKKLSNT